MGKTANVRKDSPQPSLLLNISAAGPLLAATALDGGLSCQPTSAKVVTRAKPSKE